MTYVIFFSYTGNSLMSDFALRNLEQLRYILTDEKAFPSGEGGPRKRWMRFVVVRSIFFNEYNFVETLI